MSQIYQFGQGDNVAGDKVMGDKVMGDKVAGDKVAGDKTVTQNNFNGPMSGIIGSSFSDNAQASGNSFTQTTPLTAEPKTPAEAAKEIQDLLLQLAQDNPLASDSDRAKHITQTLTPNRLQRIIELIQAAGEAAVEEIPGGKTIVAVLKKVREQETLLNQAKTQQQLPPKA